MHVSTARSSVARVTRPMRGLAAGMIAAAALLACAGSAQATWSILLADTRTGEVVLATSTCLTGFDMLPSTPVVLTGVGAATAQSQVEPTGQTRTLIRDGLLAGTPPGQIITQLQLFDTLHQTRQYGIVDTRGGSATFSGRQNGPYAGGRTGRVGDLAYAVQGNVITGACVVDRAVEAIEATAGSLGDKAMAAMEAAKAAGGDGRCSCNADAADACGCPPAGGANRKSAHIGVMIIARAGDADACNGVYRTASGPAGVAIADFTGDGRPDVVLTASGASTTSLFRNSTPAGASLPTLASLPAAPAGSTPRAVAVADFSGDWLPDLVVVNTGGSNVTLVRGLPAAGGGVQFTGLRSSYAVGAGPQAVAVADFTGDGRPDAVTANSSGNNVTLLRADGAGGLAPSIAGGLGVGALPTGLAAGDLDGDGATDVVVATSGRSALGVLAGRNDGTFTRLADIPLAGRPQAVAVGDFDGDGRLDIAAVTLNPSRVVVLFRNAGGDYQSVSVSPTGSYTKMAAGDFDATGRPSIAVLGGSALATVRATGERTLALSQQTLAIAATDLAAGDLDGDGRADLVMSSPGINSAVVFKSRLGVFESRAGCGNGGYYFSANVANQTVADVDPVIQLRQQYDAFKARQAGRVDAVRSEVSLDRSCVFAGFGGVAGAGQATIRVVVRDLAGAPVVAAPEAVIVRHAAGSTVSSVVGLPVLEGDGSISVRLGPIPSIGTDRFRIDVADPAGGVVTLMPEVTLVIRPNPDTTGDGVLDPDDIATQVACTFSDPPCPRADFNQDGRVDPDDLSDFISAYFSGCF